MLAFDAFNSHLNEIPRKELIQKINREFDIPVGTLYDWYLRKHIPYGRKGQVVYKPEIFYVLGALMGDGCLYKWKPTNNYAILVGDQNFTAKYSKYLTMCINKRVRNYIIRSKNIWFVRTNNYELYELFKKSRQDLKYLKQLIQKNGKQAALFFVEGFFDAEGCVKIIKESSRKTPKICLDITNTNLELLTLVRELLLENTGIEPKFSLQKPYGNRKTAYHLRIYRKEDVKRFLKLISTTKLKTEKIAMLDSWLNNGR